MVQFRRGAACLVEGLTTWEGSHCARAVVPFSVVTMVWSGEQRGFVIRTFFESGRSFIATQRAFRLRYNIPHRDPVPHHNVIARWVQALEETKATVRRRGAGRPRNARTPENLARVRAAVNSRLGALLGGTQ